MNANIHTSATTLNGAVLSVTLLPIQLTVPNRVRGQTMSIAYCGVTLLGAGLGPFLVGFLNKRTFWRRRHAWGVNGHC
jgi:MFS family permease